VAPTVCSSALLNAALFDACCNIKQHAPLMTAGSSGLRISETLALVRADIDSRRMII
jgi:hypothetical protein